MKVCYCDESGMGEEPIAVMVGVVVDSHRMHLTKDYWTGLLEELSKIVGRKLAELHTRNFYSGNGVWKEMDGNQRANVITIIFDWLRERKHHLVYTSVLKEKFFQSVKSKCIPQEINTLWKFLGFHLILAMQKAFQTDKNNKGNTIFIFDNEEREQLRFTELISKPPEWSDTYYKRREEDKPLNQIIDTPYFGDSREVALVQVADFVSFFLRRYAEIKEGLVPTKYHDEEKKLSSWVGIISERSIGTSFVYPSKGRCSCADLFYLHAPKSLRNL